MTNLKNGETEQTKNSTGNPTENKEKQTERLNEQQVDEIINSVPEVKDKINKEADRIAKRLTLEGMLVKEYNDEKLQTGLNAYRELDSQNYEKIVKLRTEIASNPKQYSDSELEEAKNKLEVAFEVERNIHKHREMYRKQQSESRPTIEDSRNPEVLIPHREFPASEKYSLRDVYDDACKEASVTWANELAEFRRRRPSVEKIVKHDIV